MTVNGVWAVTAGNTAAVTQESGEVAACSLARERRRRQSLVLGPLRANLFFGLS